MRRVLWFGLPYCLALWVGAAVLVQPVLHYHVQQTAFLWGTDFLVRFLTFPGGLAEYAALGLMQWFSVNWIGALVLAVLGAAFAVLGLALRPAADPRRPGVLVLLLLPGILLVSLFLDYRFPLVVPVRLLLAWVALLPVAWLRQRRWGCQGIALVLMASALYYAAGGVALWVWAAGILAIEVRRRPDHSSLVAITAVAGFTAFLAWAGFRWVFLVDREDAWWHLLPRVPHFLAYEPGWAVYLLCAWGPLMLLIGRWLPRLEGASTGTAESSAAGEAAGGDPPDPPPGRRIRWSRTWLSWVLPGGEGIVLVIAAVLLMWLQRQPLQAARARVSYYADAGEWLKVLQTVTGTHGYDRYLNVEFARALAHRGELGDKLFVYPQILGVDGIFPDGIPAGEIALPSSDLYFDLGQISASERWAFEAQTLLPNSPRALKRLVVTRLIKGDYRLATEFLTVLDRNSLCRDWVRQTRALLADTSRIAADSLIACKRRQMPVKGIIPTPPNEKLKELLVRDNTNWMAYEYLQVYYLLSHQLADFAGRLPADEGGGYARLPKAFEEAYLLYALRRPDRAALLAAHPVSQATGEAFAAFNAVIRRLGGDLEQARPELRRSFRDTYWYYVTCESPLVTKAKLKTREGE